MDQNWQQWIEQLGHEKVSHDDLCNFERALSQSTENQSSYAEDLLVEVALEIQGGLPSIEEARKKAHELDALEKGERLVAHQVIPQGKKTLRRKKGAWVFLAMAACLGLLLSLSYLVGHQRGGSGTVETVATVTDSDAAAEAVGLRIGKPLGQGEISVPAHSEIGLAMRGGARLKINGPAVLRIDGPDRVYLSKGRVQTYAPEYAHGFSIDTQEGKVIDLGTRFVTTNSEELGTEIHVIEGLVQAKGSDQNSDLFYLSGEEAAIMKDGKRSATDYLAQRLKVPLDPVLLDQDGDSFPDVTEEFFGTPSDDAQSFPVALRLAESFQGYGSEQMNGMTYLGLGKASNWTGGGRFLREGLNYENGGKVLKSSAGCIETTGENGVGAVMLPDESELPEAGVIYISFLMQQPVKELDRAFSGLIFYQGDYKEELFVGELSVTDSYGARYAESLKEDPFVIPTDDRPHLFVIRMDRTRLLTDVFIDPPLDGDFDQLKPEKRYQSAPFFNRIVMRSGSDSGHFPVRFDEIRLGLTSEAVLPIEP